MSLSNLSLQPWKSSRPKRLDLAYGLSTSALLASLLLPGCDSATKTAPLAIFPNEAKTSLKEDDVLDAFETRVAEAIEQVRGSVVTLEYTAMESSEPTRRIASGVVISEDGDVLSVRIDPPPASKSSEMVDRNPNSDINRKKAQIVAHDAQGRRLPTSWVAADPETGLTLLKIEAGHARAAVPSTRGPRLGIPVLVIGNPFGLGHSVSRGFVSGIDRRIVLGPRHLGGLIQVDATFHPGDSGALLADLRGGWLGVVRSGLATPDPFSKGPSGSIRESENDHDLGFVIPAHDALWVAAQLKQHQRVNRAYLGITMVIPEGNSTTDHDSRIQSGPGARLDHVIAETPADRAGLQPGDRILGLNGVAIRSATDLTEALDHTLADTEVLIDLVRRGDPLEARKSVRILTAERPSFEATSLTKPAVLRLTSDSANKVDQVSPTPPKPTLAERLDQLEKRLDALESEEAEASETAPR